MAEGSEEPDQQADVAIIPSGTSDPTAALDFQNHQDTAIRFGMLARPPVSASDVLNHFFAGKSPNTVDAYRRDVEAFAKWLDMSTEAAVAWLLGNGSGNANALMLRWMDYQTKQGKVSSTIARQLSALKSLVKLANMLGLINWQLSVEAPTVEAYRDTRGPGVDGVQKLLKACGNDLQGQRDRTIVLMLVTLGLRRAELCRLCLKDYDQASGRLYVVGKGNKEVTVTVPLATRKQLDTWIKSANIQNPDERLFFAMKTRRPLSFRGLWWIIHHLGERAGIKTWPHGLRHTGITTGLEKHDIRTVKRFSRHAKIETVLRYDDNRQDLGAHVAESVTREILDNEDEET